MSIESNIFERFIPNFKKLKDYGFIQKNGKYYYEKLFKYNTFKAVIEITKDGGITGKVYDLENNDEYLPLRIEEPKGKFANTVKKAYEEILLDIRNRCFNQNYFIYPQANRIADYIIAQYNDKPEFLWKKFPGYGVFRNPDTRKWYGIIMNIDMNKLEEKSSGETEIINLKLNESKIQDLIKQKGYYPAYHMNKNNWVSIVLDDTVKDDNIIKFIDESHEYSAL